jgi:hypothetical protein
MLVDILSLEQGVFANTTLNVLRLKAFQQPDAATGDFLLFLHMLVHTARLECLLVGLLNVHVYLCGHIHTHEQTRAHTHTLACGPRAFSSVCLICMYNICIIYVYTYVCMCMYVGRKSGGATGATKDVRVWAA